MHTGTHGDIAQYGGTVVFVQHRFIVFPHEDILLADGQENRNVFLRNNMALAKDGSLCNAANNLRYIMTQYLTDRVFRFNAFH